MSKGIVFSQQLLPRVMDGSKTVTRRLIPVSRWSKAPYRQGDIAYVRENLKLNLTNEWTYAIDGALIYPDDITASIVWAHHKSNAFQSSRFMPKWAARTWLEIIDVRPERLHEITATDAYLEGFTDGPRESPTDAFHNTWDKLHKPPYDWAANPFVWRIEFKLAERVG